MAKAPHRVHGVGATGLSLDIRCGCNNKKALYGKQQGAVLGYNPHKPGRPSHAYHSYQVSGLRLMLGVDVLAGNEVM